MKSLIFISIAIFALHLFNRSAKARDPEFITVKYLPKPRKAMTIPPIGVFIKHEYANDTKVIDHEKCHWKQYSKNGLISFYANYMKQLLKDGYDNMDMEMACRFDETEYCKNNYTECNEKHNYI